MRQRAMIAMALSLEPDDPDRRRADDGARRDDPGADPARCSSSCNGERGLGGDPDHPRPRRRRRGRRPRARHVRGPGRRGGHARRASSTTRSTPTPGGCWARSRGSTSRAPERLPSIPGLAAVADLAATGLPLPAALPARVRASAREVPPLEARLPEDPEHRDRCWLEPGDEARASAWSGTGSASWRSARVTRRRSPGEHAARGAAPGQVLPDQGGRRCSTAPSTTCTRSTTSRFTLRAGRDARARGRVGLRQVDAVPHAAAPRGADARGRSCSRAATSRPCGAASCGRCAARCR